MLKHLKKLHCSVTGRGTRTTRVTTIALLVLCTGELKLKLTIMPKSFAHLQITTKEPAKFQIDHY